jgi:hypothetical protein
MSYLSLPVPSATQGILHAFGAESISLPQSAKSAELTSSVPDTTESAWTGVEEGPHAYRLPLGIASLEHWLDLNA